ncbi:hypothetical protein [Anabaena sp. PCC 7108]|uniref:hypothetical protein n=1 Tax=Anabaena sp. PCC 7108 TaxID=163908 RepID=UPI000345E886|nr:hypothetical protein [Anabaena sp. PCC 7108]
MIPNLLINVIKDFTQQVKDWTYLQKESEEHIKETSKPSCILSLDNGYHQPKFLITKRNIVTKKTRKNDQLYYSIVNIFNSQHGYISMLEYNALLRRFYQDFNKFINSGVQNISIEISKEDIGLNEIISSPKTRERFERYLSSHPQSYHRNDIERLDLFICAASGFCKRKKINTELIQQYLVEDLNWSKENAMWCRNRIDVGLEILEVNKKFDDL